ncbi:retrovirus-related pol polyprotein from transposon TNT 1-94 [Tanacetum coccineum]|uniref:Retrovirus-related pol polyprotein from transposon TNT 1-94 n=1 Tax=Tanacetum coccineum TaxID=301880 RepID=A0ABQ5DT23_9ASTR
MSSPGAGFKPSSDDGKKVDEDSRNSEGIDQEKEDNINNTNNVNAANINEVNDVCGKTSIKLPDDLNMPPLEDIVYSDDDEDVGAEADMNNLDAFMPVWTLLDLPNGKRPIGTKWVFRNKKDERGTVIKNKVRLVAQGYTQEEGVNYDEFFALVARIEAIRLFLAYASFKDFVVYQMDVNSAFLYGKIEEEVYVCQPPGFEDPDFLDRVYKVEKALYGLHQAPRACQDKYVTEILKKFGFTDVKIASTPMETQKHLIKDKDGEEVDVHLYRSMIGSLMYLTSSRPDIMFAATVKVKTVNGEVQLQALVDGKKIIITEATVRRDLQLEDAEEKELEGMSNHNRIYVTPSHIKKIFANMRRQGKDFSGSVTPLFPTTVVLLKKKCVRRPKRKDTEIPQSSGPTTNVAD